MINTYKYELCNFDGFVQYGILYATSSYDAQQTLTEIEKIFENKYGEGITFSNIKLVDDNKKYIEVDTRYEADRCSGIVKDNL